MYSLEAIKQLNEEAALKAKARREVPAVFSLDEIEEINLGNIDEFKRIPYIGEFLPKGWMRVKLEDIEEDRRGVYEGDNLGFGAYFVDSTGFGHKYEPALTVTEFAERVQPKYGYAIVEAGQFQVKIGVFSRVA